MRINQFLAHATGMSRRGADAAISAGRVRLNGRTVEPGQMVQPTDRITLDGQIVAQATTKTTIMLNKPRGYVCSRQGQGSQTIYDLLPTKYHRLKPIGRLDKDSSGLLLLTDDGQLAHQLTHPSFRKLKTYEIRLNHDLAQTDFRSITKTGVSLEDGPSKFALDVIPGHNRAWRINMHEGRNRQIRRTFAALGYRVTRLQRVQFGPYSLNDLAPGSYAIVNPKP